jgi:hypothetical protein
MMTAMTEADHFNYPGNDLKSDIIIDSKNERHNK